MTIKNSESLVVARKRLGEEDLPSSVGAVLLSLSLESQRTVAVHYLGAGEESGIGYWISVPFSGIGWYIMPNQVTVLH